VLCRNLLLEILLSSNMSVLCTGVAAQFEG
jgi:hypothetical protein